MAKRNKSQLHRPSVLNVRGALIWITGMNLPNLSLELFASKANAKSC